MPLRINCKLADALNEKGMSQNEFCKRSGFSPLTVRKFYHNRSTRIDYDTLLGMCTILGKRIDEILVIEKE